MVYPEVESTNKRSERQARPEAMARKMARTSKTAAGAKRRGIIMSVLASHWKRLERFTLGNVLSEIDRCLETGRSVSQEELAEYQADTVNFNLAQEMFGGMTTLTLGYSVGNDVVSRVDNDFEDEIDRYSYRLGLSQILSKTLLVNVDYEAIADDGFLNSPYRAARILGAFVPERYPRTRESQALTFRALKYLQSGKSVRAEYRRFWDTWDISADTLEFGFNKYFGRRWLMELRYRYYTQDAASFYSDNFPAEQNFMARDKELSTFTSNSLGGKFSYTFLRDGSGALGRGTFTFSYDVIEFDYDDFTDVRNGKLFSFDADVIQLFISLWY